MAYRTKNINGNILILSLIFCTLFAVFIATLTNLSVLNTKTTKASYEKEKAFQIAEAGINYYRWHLAHFPNDYKDGTGIDGPYVHVYNDKDENPIGEFSLDIIEPPLGSTLVTITSTGHSYSEPNKQRIIRTEVAIPSIAKFSFVSDDYVWFGDTEETFGHVHSNQGVRHDGIAHNLVTSARHPSPDPTHSGPQEDGVHTHRPPESQVFLAGKINKVDPISFSSMISDLAEIKAEAQANGIYFSHSGESGYHMVLRNDGTFDIHKVLSLESTPNNSCKSYGTEQYWGLWSILTEDSAINYAYPANGIIFVEDNLWINGQINGQRLTIAAGRFPDTPPTNSHIIINDNLLYTNYDGTDVIGLIAQRNISIGLRSPLDLRIDAAQIAQQGRIGRYFYPPLGFAGKQGCGADAIRNSLISYGMQASNKSGGLYWYCGSGCGSGYPNQQTIYDANLLFAPPPDFPETHSEYSILSWEEL